MRYIEVTINTPKEEIDLRCEQMAAMGAGGFVIENEDDFKDFLERNHQYWDYVDESLESQFRGVSRVKFYLSDDEEGRTQLEQIRAENIRAVVDLTDFKDSTGAYMPNAKIYVDGVTEVGAIGKYPISVEIRFSPSSMSSARMSARVP